MTFFKKLPTMASVMVAALLLLALPALAQVSGKAFDGFKGNSKDPIQIEADELEVLDGKAQAIFKGNVKVRQGTSVITTSKLVVHYAKGGKGGQNDIEKLNLSGGLVVTSKTNTATADKGVYNVKTEGIVLDGNVVISQGKNVATGCKLVANLKTNVATLLACKGKGSGRVKTVFTPGTAKKN